MKTTVTCSFAIALLTIGCANPAGDEGVSSLAHCSDRTRDRSASPSADGAVDPADGASMDADEDAGLADPTPPRPPSGSCSFPERGPNPTWPTIGPVDVRRVAWPLTEVNVIAMGQNGIGPDVGSGGIIDDIYVRVDGGDGIKPHDGMEVTNTYFDIDGTSGHADIAQFQGTTDWHFENVVMEYRGGPRDTVTAHFFVQNKLGGGRGDTPLVEGTINCLKLVGRGSPWGHDIRLGSSSGRQVIRLTNVTWPDGPPDAPTLFAAPNGSMIHSRLVLSGGSNTTVYVDDTVPDLRIMQGGATVIRE